MQDGEVVLFAIFGAVEIDDVEPLSALVLELEGLVGGVVVVVGLAIVVALLEADALAVAEIDGG